MTGAVEPGGPPPGWAGDWAALAPEAQTAVWQQYAIQQSLAMQREQVAIQRSSHTTRDVVFWVVFALALAVVLVVAALAISRLAS